MVGPDEKGGHKVQFSKVVMNYGITPILLGELLTAIMGPFGIEKYSHFRQNCTK